MKLTPHERDILYAAIREPLILMRQQIDDQLYKLEKTIWSRICHDLPDCLVGETEPNDQINKTEVTDHDPLAIKRMLDVLNEAQDRLLK